MDFNKREKREEREKEKRGKLTVTQTGLGRGYKREFSVLLAGNQIC